MLSITIPAQEIFNEATSEFSELPEIKLELEHSLVALSKWESEFEKPFLTPEEKSTEEAIGYIRAMTLTDNVPDEAYKRLGNKQFEEINAYIEAKMTATWFTDHGRAKKPASREIVTSELIYHWMIDHQVPKECEVWHLKRLITLIEVRSKKNAPPKKMSKSEMLAQRDKINAERKARMGSSG
jgi:hypothetical protein